MKKILFYLVIGLTLVSCNSNTKSKPLYNQGDYVWFTQPGYNKIDTLLGEIDFEPLLLDTLYTYRIKYVTKKGFEEKNWIYSKSIIGKVK
jgi:hypothetical protein